MINYYLNVNAQSSGEHEIHKESCRYYYKFKVGYNFELLGAFSSDVDALNYARRRYPNFRVDGCAYCCPKIHKR